MPSPPVLLRPMSRATAEAVAADRGPPDVQVADDYPSEFSKGVASLLLEAGAHPHGPFCIHRAEDGVVIGEIGAHPVAPGTMEIGFAIVRSAWGSGYATAAVKALLDLLWTLEEVERVIAHHPLDRPASGRVLEKAGFVCVGEVDDEHEGQVLRVTRWQKERPAI